MLIFRVGVKGGLAMAEWLFQGESVRITTTATSAFPLVCTGVTED